MKNISLVSFLEWFGELGSFCARLVRDAFAPPFEGKELIRQMDEIGSKSLPLVALAGTAIGVVLTLHTRESLIRFGAKSLLPAIIILTIIKESGPIITALVISGRVGAGISAELGSMKVTEQIDAIEASAVNPYKFLVATRVSSLHLNGSSAYCCSRFLRHPDGLGGQQLNRTDFIEALPD